MPLNRKGKKIKKAMQKTYKDREKAEQVFHASKNAGKIKGVDAAKPKKGFARQFQHWP